MQGKGKSDGSRRWQESRGFSCGSIPILGTNYRRNRQRRPPYFLNSRLIKAADEFKHKTTAINKLWQTDGSRRMTAAIAPKTPSDFILAYAPVSEGQSLQGADIQQQSQAERLPRCPGDALETRFCSVAPANSPRWWQFEEREAP